MFKNNLKIGFRSLWRNKGFTIINIAGLALGISVFMLIMEYVAFEWGYNRFNKNFDQLYRASVFDAKSNTGDYYLAPGIAPAIKNNFPAVADVVRIADGLGNGLVSIPANGKSGGGVKSFKEDNVSFTDASFFSIFSFPVIAGNGSLKQAQTMALSQATAKKYFGNGNAIGRVLTVSNQFGTIDYVVTTVFNDMPEQSDIKADILLSMKTLESPAFRNQNDWADPNGTGSGFAYLYFKLSKGTDPALLSSQITPFLHKLVPGSKDSRFGLQPMASLHLAPGFSYNYQTCGSLVLVVSLLSIAVLILIVAWVNYINLSTAQALNRAKEVGVRKVLGAGKGQVIGLQLTETGILLFFSIAAAIFMVNLFQPVYNAFIGHSLSMLVLSDGWFLPVSLLAVLAGTFLAGSYVSVILSSFDPLKTIRGKSSVKVGGVSLRKGLLVFQFAVSVLFIIGTITLYRQLSFMQNQDLGFKPQQLLVVNGPNLNGALSAAASQTFKNDLGNLPFVKKIAASNNIPGQGYNFSTQGITRLSHQPGDEKKSYSMLIVDGNYFDTYGIKIMEGAAFTPLMVSDGWRKAKKVIINEAAAEQLGFKHGEQTVGQKINWGADYEVVGVVKDYHHLSLHTLIKPMVFLPSSANGYFTVKTGQANPGEKLNQIRRLYKSAFPGDPFIYSFVDELFDRQYNDEHKMGQLFISSAVTAIFIACLGLFGLAAYSAKQRTKEIGIRKVLGAGVSVITAMLAKDFLKLIAIAVLLASPIAWLLMQKWLQSFAYHINMQWWVILFAGFIVSLIAIVTIGFQSVKAALANPVESLRSE